MQFVQLACQVIRCHQPTHALNAQLAIAPPAVLILVPMHQLFPSYAPNAVHHTSIVLLLMCVVHVVQHVLHVLIIPPVLNARVDIT